MQKTQTRRQGHGLLEVRQRPPSTNPSANPGGREEMRGEPGAGISGLGKNNFSPHRLLLDLKLVPQRHCSICTPFFQERSRIFMERREGGVLPVPAYLPLIVQPRGGQRAGPAGSRVHGAMGPERGALCTWSGTRSLGARGWSARGGRAGWRTSAAAVAASAGSSKGRAVPPGDWGAVPREA